MPEHCLVTHANPGQRARLSVDSGEMNCGGSTYQTTVRDVFVRYVDVAVYVGAVVSSAQPSPRISAAASLFGGLLSFVSLLSSLFPLPSSLFSLLSSLSLQRVQQCTIVRAGQLKPLLQPQLL